MFGEASNLDNTIAFIVSGLVQGLFHEIYTRNIIFSQPSPEAAVKAF